MKSILAICCLLFSLSAWANQLESIRVWPSPDNTRIVLDLGAAPRYEYFLLYDPHRLVIDLEQTQNRVDFSAIKNSSELITTIRHSTPQKTGSYRLVFELAAAVKPVIFPLTPAGDYGHRLVIDLPYQDQSRKPQQAVHKAAPVGQREIVVAIDAGHGGEDPGAIGPRKNREKHITLSISRRLADLINKEPGMRAVLTRTGDYFVNLNQRSEIARKARADLLLSIHADSVANQGPRGASVWLLSSNRANREMAGWLEKQERQSELLGGVGEVISQTDGNPYLTRTFLDLSMDRSRADSYAISEHILAAMGKVVRLHKSKPEHASLAVLKSPDIPSLLIEAGFISNPQEEQLLITAGHQQKIAQALFNGVKSYYRQNPLPGTMMAGTAVPTGARQHTVRTGESLSVIAQRYGVSIARLKGHNQLRSDVVKVGQVLDIPSS
ncbi:N-acetylmuramoyl-L-alanine amidase [Zobellella taiwanensis]|jgi:N-acetylmuramoyl-L-alanine amidase|uniref:N-acetylmuramoyl-L-alanine amidase AmiC n=1 Tax=Zobellella taiwanensis TaxID=347535 RepID=A0A2P7QL77_9GAMM|nr:N-acetylmuramoyl-L-alanine amidase [Zobellella taiwanensis]PSJ38700.1 N-acetylmuramoyl-L-alanine amidase [Zobellella taiwanensis]